jgi:hypothetical protein
LSQASWGRNVGYRFHTHRNVWLLSWLASLWQPSSLSWASDWLFLKIHMQSLVQNYYRVWELVHVYSHFLILLVIRTQLLHLPKVAMYIYFWSMNTSYNHTMRADWRNTLFN